MTSKLDLSQKAIEYDPSAENVDLKQVFGALNRRRGLVAKVTLITFAISVLYAITKKPVWEGQFQIVLETQDDVSSSILDRLSAEEPLISSLAVLSGGESPLETEVKILESPSVLKPTYDFVKRSKAEKENVLIVGHS